MFILLDPVILILIKSSKEITLNMQSYLYAEVYYSSRVVKTPEVTKIANNRMIKKTSIHRFDGIVISHDILWV